MVDTSELLRRVPAFADLPDDQIAWFLSESQELHLNAGDTYARQGEPADAMFVLLEGEFQWRGELAGQSFVLAIKAGEISGMLPFSRMKKFTLSGRALTDGRVLRFPASLFPDLSAENAGTGHAPGRRDVRQNPRGHSLRTATRPACRTGQAFGGPCS